jgi:hypothetical protein
VHEKGSCQGFLIVASSGEFITLFVRKGRFPTSLRGLVKRLSGLVQAEVILPVHVIGIERNLYGFPNDVSDVYGFCGEGTGVLELDGMSG